MFKGVSTMMIDTNCNTCNKLFQKDSKEIKRRLKVKPDCKFYCSLSCSGKQNAAHLRGINPFVAGTAHHARAVEAAKLKNTKYYGELKHINECIRRCRQRKRECSLTLEYLMTLWESQHGKCAITNMPISFDSVDIVQLASLDRIDSSKGYVEGNVQFISCCLNLAKSTLPSNRIYDFIQLIIDNYKNE